MRVHLSKGVKKRISRRCMHVRSGGEMVDTGDLKSPGSNAVLVRVRSRASFIINGLGIKT